ncbi:MAG: molybdopterin-guanine dinucleotide biosynthesis protein B [Mariniblastus sp.]|nr:molybdopterin-guanine dinucleotide biosynthesis protein B [Mariniblastus sp.]
MKRIHIIGRKNSGKTTLIVELVTEFTRRGYRVGTIKHTHHNHELDAPGKDSHRHREAGSAAVGILTKGMNAIFWPQTSTEPETKKYSQFDSMMQECDVVLVEGDSQTDAPKVEVFRSTTEDSPLAFSDSKIAAVISDDVLKIDTVIWKRSDLNSVADKISLLLNLQPPKHQ